MFHVFLPYILLYYRICKTMPWPLWLVRKVGIFLQQTLSKSVLITVLVLACINDIYAIQQGSEN